MVDTQNPIIEFKDAAVKRSHRVIWSHGNFSIPRGSVTAIVGTNGTGKTTMLAVELGILPLSQGTVRILDKPAGKANARIGYVPQNYTSAGESNITVFDFVMLGISANRWGFIPTTRRERDAVRHTLEFVQLTEQAQLRLNELSGGQRQRAAIAQALVNNPELLILDEPLANLDVASQNSVIELLARLNKEFGMTIQMVAHDLNVLLPVLTGAVYLLDGHPHYADMDNVLDSDLLTHLYGTKVEVITTPQGDMFVTHNSLIEPTTRIEHDTHSVDEAAHWHTPSSVSSIHSSSSVSLTDTNRVQNEESEGHHDF
ncbi:metal ABC transporter ATP-binding protein [Alloscardovia venturai]|uniref:Metal ABC transporter ATP-binding protein n=1 Tax=Alloscardovia venturai TaxID=1769421 RepID=A0ABW2Y6K4_9BIFI